MSYGTNLGSICPEISIYSKIFLRERASPLLHMYFWGLTLGIGIVSVVRNKADAPVYFIKIETLAPGCLAY